MDWLWLIRLQGGVFAERVFICTSWQVYLGFWMVVHRNVRFWVVVRGFQISVRGLKIFCSHAWPAIPHAFRVRLQQLPSPMRDTRLRLLPYFQNIFALIAPTLYMLSLSKNCPNLNFHCPICQSHATALLPGWQVCDAKLRVVLFVHCGSLMIQTLWTPIQLPI